MNVRRLYKIIVGGILFLLMGPAIIGLQKATKPTPIVSVTTTPTPITQKTNLDLGDGWETDTEVSPNGDFLAYLRAYKNEDQWKVEFDVTDQNGSRKTDWLDNSNIKEGWVFSNKEDVDRLREKYLVTWSRDSRSLAAIIGDKLYVWRFGATKVSLNIEDQQSVDVSPPDYFGRLYFSEDAQRVYMYDRYGMYQIYPTYRQVYKTSDMSKIAWPLPTGDDYIYWKEREQYGDYDLVAVRSGRETVYRTPLTNVDGPNTVMVSPDQKHVCVETGSSGYYGYSIFVLGSQKMILHGQEYSWCERWLDNRTVIVREKPYFTQWTNQFYFVDVVTGKRTLLGSYRSE